MSEYSKQLHILKNGVQTDIKLYTDKSEASTPAINVALGNVTVYGALGEVTDSNAADLRALYGGTTYAALKEVGGVVGLRLAATGGGYGTWNLIDSEAWKVLSTLDPVLNNNTWAQIKQAVNLGIAPLIWNVGDKKAVTLNGTVGKQTFSNETYYASILGFDHNAALESGGKSSIHFILGKNALGTDIALCDFDDSSWSQGSNAAFRMNLSNTTTGGWKESYMKKTICPQFLAAMPSEWRNIIGTVTKYTDNTGGSSTGANQVTATQEQIFLLSEFEVQGARSYANESEKNSQQQYAYYANGNSKVRKNHRDGSTAVTWWLRSVVATGTTHFCGVETGGSASYHPASYSFGFAPGFAVIAD